MMVYGYTVVNTAGYETGKEAWSNLWQDKEIALMEMYDDYVETRKHWIESELFADENPELLTFDTFKKEINEYEYITLQSFGHNLQFEWIEQEV